MDQLCDACKSCSSDQTVEKCIDVDTTLSNLQALMNDPRYAQEDSQQFLQAYLVLSNWRTATCADLNAQCQQLADPDLDVEMEDVGDDIEEIIQQQIREKELKEKQRQIEHDVRQSQANAREQAQADARAQADALEQVYLQAQAEQERQHQANRNRRPTYSPERRQSSDRRPSRSPTRK